MVILLAFAFEGNYPDAEVIGVILPSTFCRFWAKCLGSKCLQSFRATRKCIQMMRRPSSIGCTSTPGTRVKTRPSSSPTSMSTRSSSLTSIPDLLQTTVSRRTCAFHLVVSTIPEMSGCYLDKHTVSFLEELLVGRPPAHLLWKPFSVITLNMRDRG